MTMNEDIESFQNSQVLDLPDICDLITLPDGDDKNDSMSFEDLIAIMGVSGPTSHSAKPRQLKNSRLLELTRRNRNNSCPQMEYSNSPPSSPKKRKGKKKKKEKEKESTKQPHEPKRTGSLTKPSNSPQPANIFKDQHPRQPRRTTSYQSSVETNHDLKPDYFNTRPRHVMASPTTPRELELYLEEGGVPDLATDCAPGGTKPKPKPNGTICDSIIGLELEVKKQKKSSKAKKQTKEAHNVKHREPKRTTSLFVPTTLPLPANEWEKSPRLPRRIASLQAPPYSGNHDSIPEATPRRRKQRRSSQRTPEELDLEFGASFPNMALQKHRLVRNNSEGDAMALIAKSKRHEESRKSSRHARSVDFDVGVHSGEAKDSPLKTPRKGRDESRRSTRHGRSIDVGIDPFDGDPMVRTPSKARDETRRSSRHARSIDDELGLSDLKRDKPHTDHHAKHSTERRRHHKDKGDKKDLLRKPRTKEEDVPFLSEIKEERRHEYFKRTPQPERRKLDEYWLEAFKRNYARRPTNIDL